MSAQKNDRPFEINIVNQMLQDYEEKKIHDYCQALNQINKYIEQKQESEAFRLRGLIYSKLKDKDKEIQDYNLALQIDSTNCLNGIGDTYFDQQLYDKAIQDCNKAIELNPKNDDAFTIRALAHLSIQQYDKAIEDFNQAIELDPNIAIAYNNRAPAYLSIQQYDQAIEDCNQTIELDPNIAKAYINRGLAYHNMQQYDKAIENYNKAMLLDLRYSSAVAVDRCLNQNADKYINIQISQNIDSNLSNSESLNIRGNTYHKMNQYDKAILDYNKAISLILTMLKHSKTEEIHFNKCNYMKKQSLIITKQS